MSTKLPNQVKQLKQLDAKIKKEVNGAPQAKRSTRKRTPRAKTYSINSIRTVSTDGMPEQGLKYKVPRAPRTRNIFLEQLLDPASHADFRLPDKFGRPSATVSPRIFTTPFYFPTGSIVEKPGRYYYTARPSLVHPLWTYGVAPYSAPCLLMMCGQSERFGITGKAAGDVTHAEQDGIPFLAAGTTYNLKLAKLTRLSDQIEDPFFDIDSAGNKMYGHTFAMGATTCQLNVSGTINGDVGLNDILRFEFINKAGTVVTHNFTLAAGQTEIGTNTANMQNLGVNDNATNGLGFAMPMPGMGVRVTFLPVGTSQGILLNDLTVKVQPAVTPANELGLIPLDWDSQQTYLENVMQFHANGGFLWSKYEGNSLENGGAHACILYQGGDHPNTTGLWNYERIAKRQEAFEGAMKKGSYQIWLPSSEKDWIYRNTVNTEEWEHPFWIASGIVGDLGQTTPLRVELYVNFELLANDTGVWTKKSVKPNPGMIYSALSILAGCPTSMENDTHIQELWGWVKRATKGTFNWIHDNSHWLVPAVASAAALLQQPTPKSTPPPLERGSYRGFDPIEWYKRTHIFKDVPKYQPKVPENLFEVDENDDWLYMDGSPGNAP